MLPFAFASETLPTSVAFWERGDGALCETHIRQRVASANTTRIFVELNIQDLLNRFDTQVVVNAPGKLIHPRNSTTDEVLHLLHRI